MRVPHGRAERNGAELNLPSNVISKDARNNLIRDQATGSMRYFFHLDDGIPNNDLDGIELPV